MDIYKTFISDPNFLNKLNENAPGYLFELDKLINKTGLEFIIEQQFKNKGTIDLNNGGNNSEINNGLNGSGMNSGMNNGMNGGMSIKPNFNNIPPMPIPTNGIPPIIPSNFSQNLNLNMLSEPTQISQQPNYQPFLIQQNVIDNDNDYEYNKKKKKSEENEKIKMLAYLDRLKTKGIKVKNFDITDDYIQIKSEVSKQRQHRKIQFGKHIFTRVLLNITRAIEFLSKKIDVINLNLDGWSRNVKFRLDEYDDIIEEIVEKYSGTNEDGELGGISGLSPELKLGILLLLSAADHSASNAGVGGNIDALKSLFGASSNKKDSKSEEELYDDEAILKEIEEEQKNKK